LYWSESSKRFSIWWNIMAPSHFTVETQATRDRDEYTLFL
jgi:hypothetical protein